MSVSKKSFSNANKFMCTWINTVGYSHNRRGSWQHCVGSLISNNVGVLSGGMVHKKLPPSPNPNFRTRSLLNAVFARHAVITFCRLRFSCAMFYTHLFRILHRAEHLSRSPPFRLIYPNSALFPICLCTALQFYE